MVNLQIGLSVSLFQATLEGEILVLWLDEDSYRAPVKQFSHAEVTNFSYIADSREQSRICPVLRELEALQSDSSPTSQRID